jgi:hypothetical protein
MKAFQATPLVWLVSRERERERERERRRRRRRRKKTLISSE